MGTMAVNRLGQKFTATPERVDRTPNLVASIMIRRPAIENIELTADGCVRFQLQLCRTGMTLMDLRGSKLLKTRWFGNATGEFLVRSNMSQFDDIVLNPNYPKLDRTKKHSQFGYRITPEFIEYKFHHELLLKIFSDNMKRELREFLV